MCSNKLLMQLANGKCQEPDRNRQVCYEVIASCVEINGT